MQCLLLRILVGLTRGSSVGLARRRSTIFSVLLFLVLPSGRMSVGVAYTATSPIRLACARTGELLARSCLERPRCFQIPSSWSFLTAHPSRKVVRNWARTCVPTRLARSRPGKVIARDCCACTGRVVLNFSLAPLTTWKYIARLGLTHRVLWARGAPHAC